MELNEAKQILNKKGYKLVESFELTDEYDVNYNWESNQE